MINYIYIYSIYTIFLVLSVCHLTMAKGLLEKRLYTNLEAAERNVLPQRKSFKTGAVHPEVKYRLVT